MSPSDKHHLQAAEGWLELGDHIEADAELDQIPASQRSHPDVLEIRWQIYAKAGKWAACVDIGRTLRHLAPERFMGWVHHSYALHELQRTREAFEELLPAAAKFPKEATVPYNLACYSCQLGDLIGARDWLAQAFKLESGNELKIQALDDPDLAPLWDQP